MNKQKFMEKYGDTKVKFSNYHNFTFIFGAHISGYDFLIDVGGNSEDISMLDVSPGEEHSIKSLNPVRGIVTKGWGENTKMIASFDLTNEEISQ